MNEREERNLERRLRYALRKQGYRLVKSRVKNWNINNWGGYMIVTENNWLVAGEKFNLSLADVERIAS